MSPLYPSSHPPRMLWMVAHWQAPACDHRKLGVLCRHFAVLPGAWPLLTSCLPSCVKMPLWMGFLSPVVEGSSRKRKRPLGSVFTSLSDKFCHLLVSIWGMSCRKILMTKLLCWNKKQFQLCVSYSLRSGAVACGDRVQKRRESTESHWWNLVLLC